MKADLGGIDFVDSDGLGSILGTYILALSHGCDLMLVNVNSRVKDLLNITHLEVVFENGRRTGLTEGARLRGDGHPEGLLDGITASRRIKAVDPGLTSFHRENS